MQLEKEQQPVVPITATNGSIGNNRDAGITPVFVECAIQNKPSVEGPPIDNVKKSRIPFELEQSSSANRNTFSSSGRTKSAERTTGHEMESAVSTLYDNDDRIYQLKETESDIFLPNDGDKHEQTGEDRPSNETLLGTAFLSFMCFSLLQLFFAFVAGSEAMMGDSAAMMVDALTYLFNWVAERQKSRFDDDDMHEQHQQQLTTEATKTTPTVDATAATDPNLLGRIRARNKRKAILRLEIIPPIISVTILVIVTIVVTHQAVKVLLLDAHRSRSEQNNPNVNLMLLFSFLNLLLDGINVFCFAKANHATGYKTKQDDEEYGKKYIVCGDDDNELVPTEQATQMYKTSTSNRGLKAVYRRVDDQDASDASGEAIQLQEMVPGQTIQTDALSDESNNIDEEEEEDTTNLNMCSAYTHVFADTLRSIAVILAAGIAEIVDAVTPEVADATAAVVVSVLILLSLIPLLQGLLQSFSELSALRIEEDMDIMLLSSLRQNKNLEHR